MTHRDLPRAQVSPTDGKSPEISSSRVEGGLRYSRSGSGGRPEDSSQRHQVEPPGTRARCSEKPSQHQIPQDPQKRRLAEEPAKSENSRNSQCFAELFPEQRAEAAIVPSRWVGKQPTKVQRYRLDILLPAKTIFNTFLRKRTESRM